MDEVIKRKRKSYIKWIVAIIGLGLFLYLCVKLSVNDLNHFDFMVYNFVSSFVSPKATKIFRFITRFGSVEVIFPLCILIFMLMKDKKKIILSIVNILGAVCLNQALKFIIERPRPAVVRLAQASGFSFPSGHSMCSLVFYGFLLYLLIRSNGGFWFKFFGSIIICSLIILIGVSRIYLGVHYSSDVIAGFALALAYLIVFTDITDKIVYNK